MPSDACEIAVIGGGGAGLAAALLLARARRHVVVIDSGAPRNAPSSHARGFLSRDDVPPTAILEVGRTELAQYGGTVRSGRVARLSADRVLHFEDGSSLRADRVLVATGLVDELPPIPGLADRWGRDVLHCPYCHAWDAGEVPFVVLGTHPNAVHHALLLRQWSSTVSLAVHELSLSDDDRRALAARGVDVVDGRVAGLVVDADDTLVGVDVAGQTVRCGAVFLFPRPVPRDGFLDELEIERDPRGFPVRQPDGRIGLPWLYAAGNAADPRLQALAAAGDGQATAFALHNELVAAEVAEAVARAGS